MGGVSVGSLQLKHGFLEHKLGSIQLRPAALQHKRGPSHFKSDPHDARELSRTCRFQRVSNLFTLPVGLNNKQNRRSSAVLQ